MPSPIAIVGSGPIAQAIGRLMYLQREPVVALASRTPSHAERAARFVGSAVRAVPVEDIPGLAGRVLIAVKDDAIPAVGETLARAGMRGGLVLHTCGARGPEVLAPLSAAGSSCAVLHPLQSVVSPEQGVRSLKGITFGLVGDQTALDWAEQIVNRLEGRVLHLRADRLNAYHAGAVMASNAVVAVVDAAVQLLALAGIGPQDARQALDALARTSLDNALGSGPQAAATGPVVRGDSGTLATHLNALDGAPPAAAALYRAAARQLIDLARRRGLAEANVVALESVLNA